MGIGDAPEVRKSLKVCDFPKNCVLVGDLSGIIMMYLQPCRSKTWRELAEYLRICASRFRNYKKLGILRIYFAMDDPAPFPNPKEITQDSRKEKISKISTPPEICPEGEDRTESILKFLKVWQTSDLPIDPVFYTEIIYRFKNVFGKFFAHACNGMLVSRKDCEDLHPEAERKFPWIVQNYTTPDEPVLIIGNDTDIPCVFLGNHAHFSGRPGPIVYYDSNPKILTTFDLVGSFSHLTVFERRELLFRWHALGGSDFHTKFPFSTFAKVKNFIEEFQEEDVISAATRKIMAVKATKRYHENDETRVIPFVRRAYFSMLYCETMDFSNIPNCLEYGFREEDGKVRLDGLGALPKEPKPKKSVDVLDQHVPKRRRKVQDTLQSLGDNPSPTG